MNRGRDNEKSKRFSRYKYFTEILFGKEQKNNTGASIFLYQENKLIFLPFLFVGRMGF
jgi:hypothetical protein